ncbi:putative ADAM metalloprotease-like [Homarus americanus]|uniref:Putative ADAM metalloprotease-like n=2 Tax=Homarus americanus TaxID=6706 RepID=A0A8J5MPS6_HOMAM|nr:putative ADAM metalloprotease-like [Homarus americanus]
MEPPRRMKPLVDALVSLGLIFLVAVIILFCCWSRIQWWWERTGRPLCLPCCASCIDSCCCPLTTKAIHWILTIRCFKTQKKNVRKEVCQVKEKAKINGEVDLDFKDCSPRTKTWGKADEKLMTEVVTLTPKKSPDIRKNIQLPSRSPVFRHKSAQELDHPTYLQSVSVDSGCIADIEDVDTNITPNSKMSMTSLISVFSKHCSLSSKKAGQNDNQLPRHFERQKSMPLSRFVVDPLVGNRSSRQGSPPPDHMKTNFRRSISSDVTNGRPGWAPLTQPPSNKTYRIDENLQKLPKLADNAFVQSENGNKLVNSSHYGQESVTQTQKKPLMPPRNSSSPPKKVSPIRVAPPPPAPTPAKGDQTKTPSMFLWKGKTGPDHSKLPGTGSDPDTKTKPPRPMHEGKSDAASLGPSKPTRVPLMPPKTSPPKPPKTGPPKPPNKGPLKLPNTGPSKSPNTALQSGAKKNVPVPSGKGVSVKDIARRLEQS